MSILVVGGAGYIGSHAVRALKVAGRDPVIFDNLSEGHRQVAERLDVPLIVGDINDPADLKRAFRERPIEAVMHFAAFAYVGESVNEPAKYYRNNTAGAMTLFEAMIAAGVDKVIFSSTCATYGDPIRERLDEDHPQRPINPYGRSKLMVEQILKDFDTAYGLRHVALRYFNAAGASEDGLLGEQHRIETHLIPLCLLAVLGKRPALTVFGADYDTPDGTCVRDYIHVDDLADAHIKAIDYLKTGGASTQLNVATGAGHSVREVVRCVEKVTGRTVPIVDGARRPGDPARLIASPERIRATLGWSAKKADLETMVASAWRWFEAGGAY
jgi:UDP-glucose-4-epimerase GalE